MRHFSFLCVYLFIPPRQSKKPPQPNFYLLLGTACRTIISCLCTLASSTISTMYQGFSSLRAHTSIISSYYMLQITSGLFPPQSSPVFQYSSLIIKIVMRKEWLQLNNRTCFHLLQ